MNKWSLYDDGRSIGRFSTEGGMILLDEEHLDGSRITLKRGDIYVSVSCNIYGWIDHTRFFGTVPDAERDFAAMKYELGKVMDAIKSAGPDMIKGWEAISEFVRRFP
jgi:hypothetical protein